LKHREKKKRKEKRENTNRKNKNDLRAIKGRIKTKCKPDERKIKKEG
jgi:hypothetical protein